MKYALFTIAILTFASCSKVRVIDCYECRTYGIAPVIKSDSVRIVCGKPLKDKNWFCCKIRF
jgi:hypothetical protein